MKETRKLFCLKITFLNFPDKNEYSIFTNVWRSWVLKTCFIILYLLFLIKRLYLCKKKVHNLITLKSDRIKILFMHTLSEIIISISLIYMMNNVQYKLINRTVLLKLILIQLVSLSLQEKVTCILKICYQNMN